MSDTKKILKVLRSELALQKRHCKLLEAQEQALLTCDRARFTALQAEHTRMLIELELQDGARKAVLLDDQGEALTLTALGKTIPSGSRSSLAALENSLRQTLERVQKLTCRNQALIQNELDYIAFTLDLFVEAGRNAENGYGPLRNGAKRGLICHPFLDRRA